MIVFAADILCKKALIEPQRTGDFRADAKLLPYFAHHRLLRCFMKAHPSARQIIIRGTFIPHCQYLFIVQHNRTNAVIEAPLFRFECDVQNATFFPPAALYALPA